MLKLTSQLPRTLIGRHVASQLLRSGTSIGANVHEARSAESRADFIHKMQVALKEARETHFWMALIHESGLADNASLSPLSQECDELQAILAKSIMTARKNGASS
jgi:four helix bundle protein